MGIVSVLKKVFAKEKAPSKSERKLKCIRSDGFLKVGTVYTMKGFFMLGWVCLKEEPFMSYNINDFTEVS